MTDRFPPQTSRCYEMHQYLGLLATVIPDRAAVYVSGPVTTGKRYWQWNKALAGPHLVPGSADYQTTHVHEVMTPNQLVLRQLVNRLRRRDSQLVIDPTGLALPDWTQDDYRVFWAMVIERFAHEVVFADSWEYSNGSAYEFLVVHRAGIAAMTARKQPLTLKRAVSLLKRSVHQLRGHGASTQFLTRILAELQGTSTSVSQYSATIEDLRHGHFKDTVLAHIADAANVAQFVSYSPDLHQRHARVHGLAPDYQFASMDTAVETLLKCSPEHSINIRSFRPDQPEGQEFIYGLRSVSDVITHLTRLSNFGLFTILNETIDVNDGGVSGVVFASLIEFAPRDTPRCVERAGTLSMPFDAGLRLLQAVYGFCPALSFPKDARVEFSIHPRPRGFLNDHTIIWETTRDASPDLKPTMTWPNHFSRMIGDKAFGLLLADTLGLPVPSTTVLSRAIKPFRFGTPTMGADVWIRPCPPEPIPGFFATYHGWQDPIQVLASQDPDGSKVASLLVQEAVTPLYSGALVTGEDGAPIIEGVHGPGSGFMKGEAPPEDLPPAIRKSVMRLFEEISVILGPIKLEWVYDGSRAWVLQLHRGAMGVSSTLVFPGDAKTYHRFDTTFGIEALRKLISNVQGTGEGIVLVGDVGITSHLGDLLRRARIPSRIERTA